MKKYKYKYCLYTNNLCAGYSFIAAYDTLKQAEFAYYNFYINKYGCCDITKKRFYI